MGNSINLAESAVYHPAYAYDQCLQDSYCININLGQQHLLSLLHDKRLRDAKEAPSMASGRQPLRYCQVWFHQVPKQYAMAERTWINLCSPACPGRPGDGVPIGKYPPNDSTSTAVKNCAIFNAQPYSLFCIEFAQHHGEEKVTRAVPRFSLPVDWSRTMHGG
jgi:hypothetical protein